MTSLCEAMAEAFRRALVATAVTSEPPLANGPGVVVFDESGAAESISPAAERWIEEMIEILPFCPL